MLDGLIIMGLTMLSCACFLAAYIIWEQWFYERGRTFGKTLGGNHLSILEGVSASRPFPGNATPPHGRGPQVDDEQKQAVQRFADMIGEHGIGGKPLILPKYLYDQISEMGVTLNDNIVRMEDMPVNG